MDETAVDVRRFEVLGHLGGGGMADVFLARMTGAGPEQTVALKRIRHEFGKNDVYTLHFEREARICALLEHENIVSLRHTGRDAQGPFLALEYVEGHSLADLIHRLTAVVERCPLPVVGSIGRDVAAGLTYAHHLSDPDRGVSGIIHRDISPGNVLVGYSGIAKLSDFGIAKAIGGTRLTHTGTIKGKIAYMAPELFEGQEASAASDVFSLGATLFHLACGAPPFEGRTEGELMRAVLHAVPVRPRVLRPDLPPELEAWLIASLAKKPDERAQLDALSGVIGDPATKTARPQVAALMKVLFPAGAMVGPLSAAPRSRATRSAFGLPRSRAGRWLAAGGIAVAAGAAVTLWLAGRSSPAVVPAPPPAPVAAAPAPPPPVALPEPPTPAPAPALPAPAVVRPAAKPTTLWVKVRPWARIFLDGELKGITPKQPFPVTPGPHTLRLVNDELNATQTMQIQVVEHRRNEVRAVLERDGKAP